MKYIEINDGVAFQKETKLCEYYKGCKDYNKDKDTCNTDMQFYYDCNEYTRILKSGYE